LFLAVQPDVAIFGQKDYQQAAVIARMTQDLLMPIEIIAAPTSREADGLAMSSRNRNLKPEHRAAALGLCRGLTLAHQSFSDGERDAQILEGIVESTMQSAAQNQSFSIDYVDCVHPESLKPLNTVGDGGAVICVAAFVGEVRLIDNLRLDLELPAELTQWRNP
jgi:pantoate--beta-alanine ligase